MTQRRLFRCFPGTCFPVQKRTPPFGHVESEADLHILEIRKSGLDLRVDGKKLMTCGDGGWPQDTSAWGYGEIFGRSWEEHVASSFGR